MTEIEIKFKVEDVDSFRKQLKEIGAGLKSIKNQRDTYFFHTTKEELSDVPTYLRVRTTDDESLVAMHYKLEAYEWEEIETKVEDGDKVRKIYENLGFEIDVEVVKKRETYEILEGEIVIDHVENVGIYVEIEVDTMENLLRYCRIFGVEYGENVGLEGKSYADIVRENLNK